LERKWIGTAALFVLPALLLFITFTYYPFIRSLYYSFTTWDSIRKPVFIGLDNYAFLFEDRKMIAAAMNTFKMALFGLLIQNPLAIWIAVLLNRKFVTGYFLRAAVFFPVIISLVVLSVVWSQILSYEGTLNLVLNQLGLSGWVRDWLGETNTVFITIILLTQWQGLGYCVIFYLAGLQSIPADLYEASRIDGAGAIQRFLKITVPLLMPTITIVTFLIIVGGLKLFDIPYILTSGGPGTASYTLALAIYNAAFRENNAGYSIAAGVVLMLIIMVITFIQLQITRRREVEM
jgi:raffinose/stachyose/melibiose transport system permease protein